MKRIIAQSMAAITFLIAPQVALANHSGETTEDTTTVANQSVQNNIMVDQLKTDFIERSVTQEGVAGKKANVAFAAAQYLYGDMVQVFNIPVGLDVGYGFGVEANVPVVFVDKTLSGTNDDEKGLGDISAGINYHFGTPSANGLNIVTFLYKSSTGDEDKGLGSGADAYTLSYKYTKYFGGKYSLHLLGSYTFNGDVNRWGGTLTYGDSYMAVVGGSMPCLLSDKVTTSAKLTYFHADDNEFGGFKAGATDVTDLWIQWDSSQLLSGVPLGIGVKIPLQNKVENAGATLHPDKKFSFYVSAAGLF